MPKENLIAQRTHISKDAFQHAKADITRHFIVRIIPRICQIHDVVNLNLKILGAWKALNRSF